MTEQGEVHRSLPERIIICGAGAGLDSDKGQATFNDLIDNIRDHIVQGNKNIKCPVWLGYPFPEGSYSELDTIQADVIDCASEISSLLLESYPEARADFLVHSFQGVVVTHWAIERWKEEQEPNVPKLLPRVRSITTINSPLQGLQQHDYEIFLSMYYRRLSRSSLPEREIKEPLGLWNIKPDSDIIQGIKSVSSDVRPTTPFITIQTRGDTRVRPEHDQGTFAWASSDSPILGVPYFRTTEAPVRVTQNPIDGKSGDIHTAILWQNELFDAVAKILRDP